MIQWYEILLAVALLVVLVFIILIFVFKKNPFTAGGKNKDRAYNRGKALGPLRSFAGSNRFELIAPARVKRKEETAELDGVVVGYFGVLGVISLGYSGEIYGAAGDEEWVQIREDGSRHTFANPINEASAAVRALRDALFAGKQRKVPVEVVYVFTHPKVQLALPRSVAPMRTKEYKKLLKKDKYMEDCGLDIGKAAGAIRASIEDKSA